MSPAPSELLPTLLSAPAVLLVGIAVKLMDDLIDGEASWRDITLVGQAVYALAALALALALEPRVGFALFAGAYALGMVTELGLRNAAGLPHWLEAVIAVGLAALLSGPQLALQALLSLTAVQLLDDLIDYRTDASLPRRSLAHRFGRGEAALLGLIALALATIPGVGLPLTTMAAYGAITVACQWRKEATP